MTIKDHSACFRISLSGLIDERKHEICTLKSP